MTSHRQLDARSPLVLDTHDLGRRAGALREVHDTVPAPEGIGLPVIGIPEGSPINLDLRLESVSEGVLVTGVAGIHLEGECSRCLTPMQDDIDVDIQELFLYEDRHLEGEDEEEANRMQGELLDLEPALRDAVVLELPFIPLCQEECAGLCATCGTNLNEEPEHDHGPATDTRWEALAGWSPDGEESTEEDSAQGSEGGPSDDGGTIGPEGSPSRS